jgi:hypothetical protein
MLHAVSHRHASIKKVKDKERRITVPRISSREGIKGRKKKHIRWFYLSASGFLPLAPFTVGFHYNNNQILIIRYLCAFKKSPVFHGFTFVGFPYICNFPKQAFYK